MTFFDWEAFVLVETFLILCFKCQEGHRQLLVVDYDVAWKIVKMQQIPGFSKNSLKNCWKGIRYVSNKLHRGRDKFIRGGKGLHHSTMHRIRSVGM